MNRRHFSLFLTLIALASTVGAQPGRSLKTADRLDYSRLRMSFEPNVGQAPGAAHFVARGPKYSVRLEKDGPVLLLTPNAKAPARQIAISFPGARSVTKPEAVTPLEGRVNYLLGNRPNGWHRNVSTYEKVRYQAVYPGIDVVYYGHQGSLEFDFQVAPHADPSRIRLHFEGAGQSRLDASGDLMFDRAGDGFRQHQPVAYQEHGGVRASVEAHYRLLPSGDAALELGNYDASLPLVIDPTLTYATYLGGAGTDGITSIKVDASGALYVTGFTSSAAFKVVGGVQSTYKGRVNSSDFFAFGDAFVAKFGPTGSLVYSTYLGGKDDDLAFALALDAGGNAYVAGATRSTDFPVTSGAVQTKYGGASPDPFLHTGDAFVVKISPDGGHILYGTYLGGSMNDAALGIAVDSNGNATVVGATLSTEFPTTADAISRNFRGAANLAVQPSGDAFLARLNSTGTALLYSTYIGGRSHDYARAVALDAQGNAYLCGSTYSSDFPVTDGVAQKVFHGFETSTEYDRSSDDGWVMKVSPQGAIVYSTYLGGTARDAAFGIAVDGSGNAFVTGHTQSRDFPVTDSTKYGGSGANGQVSEMVLGDAFVTKLNASGALVYSTYLGGAGDECGMDIAADAAGNAYVAGFTLSTTFPVSGDALQKTFAGLGGQGFDSGGPPPEGTGNFGDAFVTRLNPQGAVSYSSFFGGPGDDLAFAVAVDSGGNVYIGGNTVSTALPVTPNAIQAAYGGTNGLSPRGDAFVARFDFGGVIQPVPAQIAFLADVPTSGAAGSALSGIAVKVTDAQGVAIKGATVTFSATNASVNPVSALTDDSGQASTVVTLGTTTGPATVSAVVAGLAPKVLTLSVTAAVSGPVVQSVVNGASFLHKVAPGSLVSLFGTGLATARADALNVPLPTELGGVKVRVNNVLIPLLVVLSTQINAQLPYDVAIGDATVTVELNGVVSAPFSFKVQAAAPGIFVFGDNRAVAQNVADNGTVSINTPDNPVLPDKLMIVYVTGQGALDHPVASGAVALSDPLSRPTANYSVKVGGKTAAIDFFGMTPGLVALLQANIHIPHELKAGTYAVEVTVGGDTSNGPNITVGAKP